MNKQWRAGLFLLWGLLSLTMGILGPLKLAAVVLLLGGGLGLLFTGKLIKNFVRLLLLLLVGLCLLAGLSQSLTTFLRNNFPFAFTPGFLAVVLAGMILVSFLSVRVRLAGRRGTPVSPLTTSERQPLYPRTHPTREE